MRCRGIPHLSALALVGTLGWPGTATAADCSSPHSLCLDDDILWPHAGPARFEAVGSIDTLATGRLGFGLVASYLSRPVVLHVASPGGPQGSDRPVVDNLVDATFLWAYAVSDRL